MDTMKKTDDFLDEDFWQNNLLELERRKRRREEKRERLQRKEEFIRQIREAAGVGAATSCSHHDEHQEKYGQTPSSLSSAEYFLYCCKRSSGFVRGTRSWALAFLGVSPQANEAEIRKAYVEKARLWHPDTGQSTDREAIQYLNEVRAILKKTTSSSSKV